MSDGLDLIIETELSWDKIAAMTAARQVMRQRLIRAALLVGNHAKRLVSRRYPPASSPGDPPALRTGQGRASIGFRSTDSFRGVSLFPEIHESDEGLSVQVGSSVDHMVYLELGTSRIEPRPWLRRSLRETRERVLRVLRGEADSGLETS